jgi:putative transposase
MRPEQLRQSSIRLQGYDYSQPGAYFITILAYHRRKLFGEVVNEEVLLNAFGRIVKQTWEWLPE